MRSAIREVAALAGSVAGWAYSVTVVHSTAAPIRTPHAPSRIRFANYTGRVRVLGIDYGARRIGLALSDATATLASPWRLLQRPPSDAETMRMIVAEVTALAQDDDGLQAVVVGWPRRLDGSPNQQTPIVETFARTLESKVSMPVVLQDERLSSREAESRLAVDEKDWRKRKLKIDAVAAAIILQDYLDGRPRAAADGPQT
jgi:putative Holliday junction resolvase